MGQGGARRGTEAGSRAQRDSEASADKAQEVTQVAGLVGAAAALFGVEASTWSGRIVTTIEALGSISGSATSSGKVCIDKDGDDEATATSTQDTQYAGQLCDTVNLTASMAAALIDNDMDLDAAIAKAAKADLVDMAIMTPLCWAPYCRTRHANDT
ncbi:hypothetical protein ERJ75_001140900 [Trypanosoma vivax]|nr:hypothetical protein ERJ75_001140900 [Trypanosoma vivax]